jgi:hypothetical protein
MTNTNNYVDLIAHLKALGNGTQAPVSKHCGICYDVKTNFGYGVRDMTNDLMHQWPKYSGDDTYPVPHDKLNPHSAYDLDDLWADDQYGDDRRELCLFLANALGEL